MTEQETQEIIKEIKEFDEWMKSSAGCDCDSIQDLIDDNGDIYEVIVTIGMTNGKEIELHNHCFESFIKQDYKGDTVYIQDSLIWAEYIDYESGDSYRQAGIAPSSICYVDARTVDLNWEALYKQHLATCKKTNPKPQPTVDEEPPAEAAITKLMEDFVAKKEKEKHEWEALIKDLQQYANDAENQVPGSFKYLVGKIVKVNESIKNMSLETFAPYIKEVPTPILTEERTPALPPTSDLILHLPNHNEKALGLLPDNQPETTVAKYWEVFGND